METPMHTDVIIVGAGPTGLSLACQCIRYGLDFVILDTKEGVTPYSKALGVHARTLEIYEQLGLAQEAVAQGTIAGKVRLVEGGEVRGEVDLSSVGQGLSAYPYMLVLEQNKNERLLYDWLQDHSKNNVLWQTEFQSLTQTESGVTAQVKDSTGATHHIEAKYLVGCDGPKSPVRHALGLAFEGSTFERLFYVADVEIDWKFPHDALHVCLTHNAVLAFFPMKGEKRYRIVGAFPEGMEKEEGDILYADIEQRIREEVEVPLTISHVNWFSVYKVHTRHVNRFSEGRCFLAGDAAHIHTPAGGQGMNTGIQDAYNLAWKLAFVLDGNADARILDIYNQERLENAKHLLQTTDRMFNMAAGSDWLLNVIRTTILPPLAGYIMGLEAARKRFFPLISQIGIQYRDSALSTHDADAHFKVKAGDRMPYFLLDGESVYVKLYAPKFHLLMFSDAASKEQQEQDEYQETQSAIDGEFAQVADYHSLALAPHITEIFGTDKPFQVLLRPDNYIGFLSSGASVQPLRDYFSRIRGQAVN